MHPLQFSALVVLALVPVPGCGFPVSDSKYEVDRTNAASFERIVAAFSGGSAACDECVRDRCQSEIEACADIPDCAELAVCTRDGANPGAQASCESESRVGAVTLETLAALAEVRECWLGCPSACAVGEAWSCLGNYTTPVPPQERAVIRQSFTYLCGGKAVGVEVAYCSAEGSCIQHAVTDATGSYTVEVPIHTNNTLAGWHGFRRVDGAELVRPHRLERNLPIWSDAVEATVLMDDVCANYFRLVLQSQEDTVDWESVVAVQLFDCHTSGAEGVELTVETAPDAKIVYAAKDGASFATADDSSKTSGEGLALIGGLPLGEHDFVARESGSGKVVGRARDVKITGRDLIFYSIFPEQAE